MNRLINASEHQQWRSALDNFARVDVCHMPEYHQAYSLRFEGSKALMWEYQDSGEKLCYPFLLSPVILTGADGAQTVTGYHDVSGIYGYSGPLSTSDDRRFLDTAWQQFDAWAADQKIISEFIRFSTYVDNRNWAHADTTVEYNRPVALAVLPDSADAFMAQLNSKTRNMNRKALKSGLVARQVDLRQGLDDFRALYRETMGRNQATEFFMYDDAYYELLLSLPEDELLLFAVYQGDDMVAAAMALVHEGMAFYHLGASTQASSRLGAGNLVLFELASGLIERGVGYFSVGGGRSTAQDDPLFRFKKSNGTSVGEFYIGKRVIQSKAFDEVVAQWKTLNRAKLESGNLQFYR